MDDFEAPSFSLGLDEETRAGSQGHTVLLPSNPFKIGLDNGGRNFQTINKAGEDSQTLHRVGELDHDSGFEIIPSMNTPRIMKRLQRKSGHSVLSLSSHPQPGYCDNSVNKNQEAASKSNISNSNEMKTCLSDKVLMKKATGSKARTLPNFWRGLDTKNVKESLIPKDRAENGLESLREDIKKSREVVARISGNTLGTCQVKEPITPEIAAHCSTKLKPNSKVRIQGYMGHSCSEKEDEGEVQVALKGCSNWSVENISKNERHDQVAFGNGKPGISIPLPEGCTNCLHDQRPGLCNCSIIGGSSNESKTLKEGVEDAKNASSFYDLSCGYSGQNEETPYQSSLHDPSFAGLGKGESVYLSQASPEEQRLECPIDAQCSKTNEVTSSQSKATALQSFWKSLSENRSSPCETDLGADEDEIENCSSEDNFEFQTQSTTKLSLCGNKSVKKSFVTSNVASNHTPLQTLGQRLSNANSVNAKSSDSFAFHYSPQSRSGDAGATAYSTPRYAVSLLHAKPEMCQHVVSEDTPQILSVPKDSRTKESGSLNNLSKASFKKNNLWPCSDDDKQNNSIFSHPSDENGDFDQQKTPTHAFQASTDLHGGEDNFSFDPISSNDPRLVSLLRLRFPHFLSLSALKQGDFAGAEHVYIDYENQFSGAKAASHQSGSVILQQQARQRPTTTKWRIIAQKNQKSTIADNNGWIQTGCRNPASRRRKSQKSTIADNDGWIQIGNKNPASRCKKSQSGGQGSQTPSYTDPNSNTGPGHWVTERTGKRIYITKDGRKLSGSSAYKQHIKDSGKHFKKAKRRRPLLKKQRHTM